MVNIGVAIKLEEHVSMDIDANICLEQDTFGEKYKHPLIHPKMCFVGETVGSTTSQKNYGLVEGPMYLGG